MSLVQSCGVAQLEQIAVCCRRTKMDGGVKLLVLCEQKLPDGTHHIAHFQPVSVQRNGQPLEICLSLETGEEVVRVTFPPALWEVIRHPHSSPDRHPSAVQPAAASAAASAATTPSTTHRTAASATHRAAHTAAGSAGATASGAPTPSHPTLDIWKQPVPYPLLGANEPHQAARMRIEELRNKLAIISGANHLPLHRLIVRTFFLPQHAPLALLPSSLLPAADVGIWNLVCRMSVEISDVRTMER